MKYSLYSLLFCGSLLTACANDNAETDGAVTDSAADGRYSDTTTMGEILSTQDNTTGNMTYNSNPLAEDERNFVMKAGSGGMMEVTLGNMAQEKGQHQRVKDFGAMMVRDHSKANSDLMALASAKGTNIPQELMPEHKRHVEMLRTKNGAEFDRAYMDMMVEDHKKDISEFERMSQNSTDTDLRAFASRTLPVLRMHLDSAQAIHKK